MGLQVNGTSAERVNFNSQAVNYVVKDGKLVWADPRIYLQSDGNQYIDTGIIFKANTVFEVDAFFDNFNIIGDVESLQCDLLTFESENITNFFYRYGTLSNDRVLNIGYVKKVNAIEVF